MGALVEDIIAGSVVVLVGGAIIGIVFKLIRGTRKEDQALAQIAEKYGSTKTKKAPKK